jgi:hypothetical protein
VRDVLSGTGGRGRGTFTFTGNGRLVSSPTVLRPFLPALAGIIALWASPSAEASEPDDAPDGPDAEVKDEDAPPETDTPAPQATDEPPKTEGQAEEDAAAPKPSATSAKVEPETPPGDAAPPRRRWGRNQADRLAKPPDGRAWMIGLEGVILQAPPLRSSVVHIDPRFVGRSIAMGGGGVFARYRPIQFIGFDLGARTGSVRYRGQDSETVVSQDQVLFDAGVLLYLGRGDVAQFAISGGLGGQYSRIGYEVESGLEGTQTFGSALFRLGAEAEFLVKRVAFVLSFRSYGVLTDRDSVRSRGDLLEGDAGERAKAPVPTAQTYLLGSAGIAFRF